MPPTTSRGRSTAEARALAVNRALTLHTSLGYIKGFRPGVVMRTWVIDVTGGRTVNLDTLPNAEAFCEGLASAHQAITRQPVYTAGQIRDAEPWPGNPVPDGVMFRRVFVAPAPSE